MSTLTGGGLVHPDSYRRICPLQRSDRLSSCWPVTCQYFSLCIYIFAIALHTIMIDGMLTETYSNSYTRWGRKALALGVLVGWLLGITGTLSELTFSRLFAFLAGGIVITSANEEFPRGDQRRFWYFVAGAMLYATLLVLV